MFIGEYNHRVDQKGRLAVPKKFRSDLKAGAVITKGLDNCLFLYPKKGWDKLASDKLSKLSITKANTRAFARHLLAGAMDVRIDSQGRIIIPSYLRKFSSINKKVILIGLYDRIEVWDETKWDAYKKQTEKNSNDIAENLGELGETDL